MSQAGVRALLDRVESDEGFRDRLLASGSVEQRRRLVQDAGYDVSQTDLPAIREMVGSEELSDEELELVAAAGAISDAELAGTGVALLAIVAAAAAL